MRNVVIFGAASAIAQATQRLLAEHHANLVLIDRDQERVRVVADDLQVRGAGSVYPMAADLNDTGQHVLLWQRASKKLGPIDTVLIAYGTLGDQQASAQDFTVAQQELTTNFLSVVSLLTIIANDFEQAHQTKPVDKTKEVEKTIAVISSIAGDRGRQSNYVYGTAKGALTIFLQGLRNRLSKSGIHVLTIKPGFVDTPMTATFKKGLLWVKPEVVARGIYRAITHRQNVVYIPWFWRYIMWLIRAIPEPIFKRLSL
jgi:decaprenylphospho-beta-D-erythro-pentofuranosid-2-ulose 2-reductase